MNGRLLFNTALRAAARSATKKQSMQQGAFVIPCYRQAASFSAVAHNQTAAPPRRRRRGGAAPTVQQDQDADARATRPVGVTDPVYFLQEAQDFLQHLELALLPMERHNDVFILKLTDSALTLTLAPGLGNYSLEIDSEETAIHFQSPVSGKFTYVQSVSTGEWVNQEDGHSLEGLLVRDLIRQCNGLPDL